MCASITSAKTVFVPLIHWFTFDINHVQGKIDYIGAFQGKFKLSFYSFVHHKHKATFLTDVLVEKYNWNFVSMFG